MTTSDIKRLNYIKYSAYRPLVTTPHCIFVCLLLFLLRIPYFFLKRLRYEHTGKLKEILFCAPTINNKKTVQPIIDSLQNKQYIVWNDYSVDLPLWRIYLFSLAHLSLFFKLYFDSNSNDKLLIRNYYWDFLSTVSTYNYLKKLIIRSPQIKLIVFANDHILVNRCLIEIASDNKIKTLYVQHASVTTSFPPLVFSYSFLDGKESYEKYKSISPIEGEVYLTGSPRFDAFSTYKKSAVKYDVGVALNELDSIEKALELCLYIKKNVSEKIVVRPHPMMIINGMFPENRFVENNIAISYPNKDLSYVFLSEIKIMIANESGIHLDAALMGKSSLLYNFSNNEVMDWYGYLQKGLIKQCFTYDDIVDCIQSAFHPSDDTVRYYAASYRTSVDGHVGDFLAKYIDCIVIDSDDSLRSLIDSVMIANPDNPKLFEFRS